MVRRRLKAGSLRADIDGALTSGKYCQILNNSVAHQLAARRVPGGWQGVPARSLIPSRHSNAPHTGAALLGFLGETL
jgi:hypothetical protein